MGAAFVHWLDNVIRVAVLEPARKPNGPTIEDGVRMTICAGEILDPGKFNRHIVTLTGW